jgi:hypothetical protein
MLPIISPATPDVPMMIPGQAVAPPPTTSKQSPESPIFFDARVVARRDEGWEDMLERALLCWSSAVVEERRSHSC